MREDSGKIAVTCGPFVYCLEEKDNGADLNRVFIDRKTSPAEAAFGTAEIAGRKTRVLLVPGRREAAVTDRGLYFDAEAGEESEPAQLRLIPYFMWANRGENEMQVWIRRQEA